MAETPRAHPEDVPVPDAVPRDEPLHRYANAGTAPVRFLAWTVGGPIDRFFEAMSERVKEMPRDAGAMAEITARFGVEMAGPPA